MYADILRIENLWQFSGLIKLQLDNNIIENIEGLETLVQLEWLGEPLISWPRPLPRPLSRPVVQQYIRSWEWFGGVGAASGPQSGSQPTDRDLWSPDPHTPTVPLSRQQPTGQPTPGHTLTPSHLHTFTPSQVSRLRPLSSLQSLTLAGNPLTSDPSYQQYTLAFIPSLIYLDFAMIFPEEVGVVPFPDHWNGMGSLPQREGVSGLFSEALADVEMGEREATRRREEMERERQLEETYQVCHVCV